MVSAVMDAFVRAKTERADEARALYGIASELDSMVLVNSIGKHGIAAISAKLATSPGAHFANVQLTAYMLFTAMLGPTRAMLEGGRHPKCFKHCMGS